MIIQDDDISAVIPLKLENCIIQFKHRLPNGEEVKPHKQHCLTKFDNTWNQLAFSYQVADKCHHKVLDEKQVEARLKSKYEVDCIH